MQCKWANRVERVVGRALLERSPVASSHHASPHYLGIFFFSIGSPWYSCRPRVLSSSPVFWVPPFLLEKSVVCSIWHRLYWHPCICWLFWRPPSDKYFSLVTVCVVSWMHQCLLARVHSKLLCAFSCLCPTWFLHSPFLPSRRCVFQLFISPFLLQLIPIYIYRYITFNSFMTRHWWWWSYWYDHCLN